MTIALELVLLGTGSPMPSANRWGPSQVVSGGSTDLLVDCGWGATRRMLASPVLRPWRIDAAFITHLHSDHISDLVDFLVMRWTGGITAPLTVYGPAGTRDMVEGCRQALREDTKFRLAHHGEKLSAIGTACEVHEIEAGEAPVEVARIGDITVKAFAVDHRPVMPAYGYRFERLGRSLVISGDTNPCPGLIAGARDTDLLVCDSQHREMMLQLEDRLRQIGNDLGASLLLDAHTYHASTEEAANVAREAGAKHLVLSHVMPPISDDGPPTERFVEGLDKLFGGKITLGHDLMRLVIEE